MALFAEFEEDFKGSIEVGKRAEFTIYAKNHGGTRRKRILQTARS